MPDQSERQKLAEQYPPEDGPYRVEDENGHQVSVAVVKPGQKVLDEPALDENGRWVKPVNAEPKAAKKAAASSKEV